MLTIEQQSKVLYMAGKMAAEARIEKATCDYAKKAGWYVRKFKSPGQRAVPDRIMISPSGLVIFIEFKAPGKLPTALQSREINIIRANKTRVHVVDNSDTGKALIDEYGKIKVL